MDPHATQLKHAEANLASPKFLLIAVALMAAGAPLLAQQPYPPYGNTSGQYGAPNQPYGYAQPQYGQPQYPQPEYGQPQYQQPHQPQQPQQYVQPQYPQGQTYEQQPAYPQQQQVYPQQQEGYPQYGTGQEQGTQQTQPPLNPDELDQLVAPIALYPDQLLAEVLTASTYPAQVAVAHQWLQQLQSQGVVSPDQIADGADAQTNWDPSVKALTAFPQVLDMMDHNLEWTTNLGNAYFNQPQDVMQTIQVMRQRAQDAGNLQSSPQEQMTYDQGNIELAPPNPQVVYVPTYNPWDVYGQPVSPYPGFSVLGALGSFFGGAPIQYGLGIAMTAFEHTPFGLVAWGLDWLAHSVLFQHNAYFTHSTSVADWGYPHGGPRAYGWARNSQFARNQGYGRANYSYARQAQFAGRPSEAFGRPVQQFARPGQGVSGYQRGESFNRDSLAQGYNNVRPAMPQQQAYNRGPQAFSRPQAYAGSPQGYGRSAYGSGYPNRPAQTYSGRSNMNYGSPYQTFRAPQANAPRAFAQAPSRGYGGFSSAQQRSSGFFSHRNESRNYGGSFGGGRAPKSFGGGGHFRAPKAGHSGGGGHHHR